MLGMLSISCCLQGQLQLGLGTLRASQNHRMVGVGRHLCGSSSPTPLPKQGHPEQAAQDLVPGGFGISPEKETPQPPSHPGSMGRVKNHPSDVFPVEGCATDPILLAGFASSRLSACKIPHSLPASSCPWWYFMGLEFLPACSLAAVDQVHSGHRKNPQLLATDGLNWIWTGADL